jgi:serine/threonine-protein kinase RIO1
MKRRAFRTDWETSQFANLNTAANIGISILVTPVPDPYCARCSSLVDEFSRQRKVLEDVNEALGHMLNIDSKQRPSAKSLKSKWGSWER